MDEINNVPSKTPQQELSEERPAIQRPIWHTLKRMLREGLTTLVPAAVITLAINAFVAQAMVVEGPSMQPSLYLNERVIVEKVTYRLEHGPQRWDVVTLDLPGEEEELIKRVVALAGETVEVRDGQVYINGQLLVEPQPTRPGGPDYGPMVVPAEHVFVLGDNRANSRDSRYFGPVPIKRIMARAVLVYWPLDRVKALW